MKMEKKEALTQSTVFQLRNMAKETTSGIWEPVVIKLAFQTKPCILICQHVSTSKTQSGENDRFRVDTETRARTFLFMEDCL